MRTGNLDGILHAGEFQVVRDIQVGSSDYYTKLLCHFDGPTGDKEVVDSGNTGHVATLVGTAQVSTAYRKIGNGSLFFDGNSDYVTIPDSADWDFGTGDFTIDMRANRSSTNLDVGLVGQYVDANNYWDFYINSAGRIYILFWMGGANVGQFYSDILTWTLGQWYHVAVVRKGTSCYIFRDGLSVYGGKVSDFGAIVDISSTLRVGWVQVGNVFFNGYIDELRISKGIARWTLNFTPQTTPYTSDSYTKLLLHMEPTDVCGNVATFVGTAQLSTAQSKFGGASLLLDGNSDYVNVPDADDWNLVNYNFTIDCWVKKAADGARMCISRQADSVGTSTTWGHSFEITAANKLSFLAYSGPTEYAATSTGTITGAGWHHVAVVRNGNTITLYIDGSADGTVDVTGVSFNYSAEQFAIGRAGAYDGFYFNGYIDEYRWSMGVARWTSNFTVPTAAYTTTATPPATQLDITGLDGNSEKEYEIIVNHVNGYNGTAALGMTINNDVATSYGYQYIRGVSATANAVRGTSTSIFMAINSPTALGSVGLTEAKLYAKSGAVRTAVVKAAGNIATTTVTSIESTGWSWNNSVDNITSLSFVSAGALGIGNGSRILLLRRNAQALGMDTGTLIPQGGGGDDGFTKLLCHFDTVSGASMVGSLMNADTRQPYTVAGTAMVGAMGSLFLDGNSDYVSVVDSADWYFGTGDFTFDFWVNFNSITGIQIFYNQGNGGNGQVQVTKDAAHKLYLYCENTSGVIVGHYIMSSAWAVSTGVWYHLAFERVGASAKIFINGVSQALTEVVSFGTKDVTDLSWGPYIGATNTASPVYFFNGYIDEFRVIKGTAVWTSDFTPQTTPYTLADQANTKLLLHFDGAAGITPIDDTGKTVTVVSTAAIVNTYYKVSGVSKFGGSALWLDGNSDYVTIPNSTDWSFGTGDFTEDFWVYFSVVQSCWIFDAGSYTGYGTGVNFSTSGGGTIYFYINGVDRISAYSWVPVRATWYHIAVTRSGTSLRMFINGTQLGATVTNSDSVNASTYAVTMGALQGGASNWVNGYIDEFRISKGIARWTAAFTPPTSAYEYTNPYGYIDGYTKLLMHCDGSNGSAPALADTGQTITYAGSAVVSTAQKKMGCSSLLLNGSNQYVTVPDNADWNFGAGNFTIDFWVYLNSIAGTQYIVSRGAPASAATMSVAIFYASNVIGAVAYVGAGGFVAGNDNALVISTWNHIAMVRNGATLTLYVNGIAQATTGNIGVSSVNNPAYAMMLGGRDDGQFDTNAYIDEFRISKGIARWTANFTPPTRPYGNTVAYPQSIIKGTWQKVYSSTLLSAITKVTIGGLDGDTDVFYKLLIRQVTGVGGYLGVRLNNDFGTNYGNQRLYGTNTSVGAVRYTNLTYGIFLAYSTGVGTLRLAEVLIQARSGYLRTAIVSEVSGAAGTTIEFVNISGNSWTNTVDNITSLTITDPDFANDLAAGTKIDLFAYRPQ